jgi:hypothetical protein
MKFAFSRIVVVALLVVCGAGLLWINKSSSVNSVNVVQYNSVPTMK